MSRTRRRASRALIGILVVTLVLGLIIHLYNLKKTPATADASATAQASTANAAGNKAVEPAPVAPAEPIVAPPALITVTPNVMAINKAETAKATAESQPAAAEIDDSTALLASVGTSTSSATPAAAPAPATQPTNMLASVTSSLIIKPAAAKAESLTPAEVKSTSPAKTESVAAAAPAAAPTANDALVANNAAAFVSKPAAPEKLDNPLAAAKAKMDGGSFLAARKILVAALLTGNLNAEDAAVARQTLNEINAAVVFSPTRYPDDEFGGTFTVPPGGVLSKIAHSHDVTPELLMHVNNISDARKLRAGQSIKMLKGPFNAVVYKHDFRIEIWQGEPNAKGSMYVTCFSVGLGKDDSTPTGVWAIQNKLKNPAYYSPRGEGVIAANDPKNPLGEYWIGLTGVDGHAVGKSSYGIHGTIDPDSVGKQESMGCIRLRNEDVAMVYELLVEGKSTVTVKD